MARSVKVNNERSEAIELIKLMDSIVKSNTWQIRSVGGESTLNTGLRRMFPDVIIYGDTARTQILQGWEVKMPDISITDTAFISDAQRKADVLCVNSCIIWNFAYCIMYVKNNLNGWEKIKEWNRASHIKTRTDVVTFRFEWEALAADVLTELNSFFVSGELQHAKIGDIVSDTIFIEIMKRNKQPVAENLRDRSITHTIITSHINQWWRRVEKEYKFDEPDPFSAYARFILLNWINKFTFANMIKGNHNHAALVETIDNNVTPSAAVGVFNEITSKCDFFNVFEAVQYGEILPAATWTDLTDYNAFLAENGIDQIPQEALQLVLENTVSQFKRSISGVFTTPQRLAEILVKAGIDNLAAPCIDPCCGTGTIAKEILSVKESAIGIRNALGTTYASDKNTFPLQVSNIAMTRANAINLPSLLFQSNVFDLHDGKTICVTNPQNGDKVLCELPKWGGIVSNLPFVAFDQEEREESNCIKSIIKRVRAESKIVLSARTDLCQAILLKLKDSADSNASIAVITSNSWLGTLVGQEFFQALNYYYNVESIIASGNGKWFDNADVVTLMLFLKNKPVPQKPDINHSIYFGLMYKKLHELSDDNVMQIVDSIRLRQTIEPELLSFKCYNIRQIESLLGINISLNSFFYDINWVLNIRHILCPVTELFDVFRGMKTGQDEIYYLKNATDVDGEYVERVFKSTKNCDYLITQPDAYSFVCDKSESELTVLGHRKTLEWINRFRGHINQSVLNKDAFWTNLSNNILSGSERIRLFTGMNPEQRIFYGLFEKPAQINQRAIGFKPLYNSVNVELCHALLNSIIGVFYAEATGFPKGLGALDNCAENSKRSFMPDPRRLSANDIKKIFKAFKPLLNRKIMTTIQEYQQEDRLAFEHVVANCYGYSEYFERVKNTVLDMQRVRLSVRDYT